MKSLNIYKQKFKEFGATAYALAWKTKGAAHQRFRQFWAEIDFNNKKVLDIGCGFGEMGNFLTKRYKYVKYKGVDIMPEFVRSGKEMYPHLDLEVGSFHELTNTEKYDVVLASGVFSSNVADNLEYRKKSIKKCFELTNNVLAFNMLGGHPAKKNSPIGGASSNVWYADSLEILEYCMTLTRRVILRHHYHPSDFTIFMYKVKEK